MKKCLGKEECLKHIFQSEFSVILEKRLSKLKNRPEINKSPIVKVIKEFALKWGNWKNAPRYFKNKGRIENLNPVSFTKGDTDYEVYD